MRRKDDQKWMTSSMKMNKSLAMGPLFRDDEAGVRGEDDSSKILHDERIRRYTGSSSCHCEESSFCIATC